MLLLQPGCGTREFCDFTKITAARSDERLMTDFSKLFFKFRPVHNDSRIHG